MKPILIDELIKDNNMSSSTSVTIDGKRYDGYQIAKPLNYEKQYMDPDELLHWIKLILQGKAIAVQYFKDLTEEEQIEYVKSKINNDDSNNNGKLTAICPE